MPYDITLEYRGTRTYTIDEFTALKNALDALTQSHQSNSPITVTSGSLRWRDGLWVQVSLSLETTAADVTTDEDTLAQAAVDAGFDPDVQTAKQNIESR